MYDYEHVCSQVPFAQEADEGSIEHSFPQLMDCLSYCWRGQVKCWAAWWEFKLLIRAHRMPIAAWVWTSVPELSMCLCSQTLVVFLSEAGVPLCTSFPGPETFQLPAPFSVLCHSVPLTLSIYCLDFSCFWPCHGWSLPQCKPHACLSSRDYPAGLFTHADTSVSKALLSAGCPSSWSGCLLCFPDPALHSRPSLSQQWTHINHCLALLFSSTGVAPGLKDGW